MPPLPSKASGLRYWVRPVGPLLQTPLPSTKPQEVLQPPGAIGVRELQ